MSKAEIAVITIVIIILVAIIYPAVIVIQNSYRYNQEINQSEYDKLKKMIDDKPYLRGIVSAMMENDDKITVSELEELKSIPDPKKPSKAQWLLMD